MGANTPKHDILSAVSVFKPDYVAISVTNYYNLVVTKQITKAIKEKDPSVKIIVGG
ncbi:MAG: cobalamin-dependent protein [Bacilli bacterium]